MLGALVRQVLTAIGAALVTRELIDQGSVDGILPMAIEVIVGAIIVAVSAQGAQVRAYASHTRWAAALAALRGETPPARGDDTCPRSRAISCASTRGTPVLIKRR